MKALTYGLMVICLLGMVREVAIVAWSMKLAGVVQLPVVDFDAETRNSLVVLPLQDSTLDIRIEASSPVLAPTNEDLLLVEGGGETQSFLLSDTKAVELGDASYNLVNVRPWVGVLPDPSGRPTMSLSIATAEGNWVENQSLVAEGHLIVGDTRIQLRPLDVGQSLESVLKAEISDPKMGRWGIHEGEQILWFDGFTPGEGAEHSDGTEITLIAFTRSYETSDGLVPAIRIREKKDNIEKDRIVTTRSEDAHVVIESEDPVHHLLDIGVWGIDAPQFILRTLDGQFIQGTLEKGKVWQSEISSLWLRFEEYESKGVFIHEVDSPFVEAVLENEDARIRIRQGVAVRVGEHLLRYKRVLPEDALRYQVNIGDPVSKTVELSSGETTVFRVSVHRCLLRYEDIDLSRGLTIHILPTFSWLRFAIFLGLSVVLALYGRSQTSKSLSKTQNTL